ncbi:hypothetical protein REPUB_Repub13aG0239200 [Reevesia pubescens]
MSFRKESLDLVLVPAGLLIMFAYHIILLYRYLYRPHTTVIGFENHDKEAWVERADKDDIKNALTVIGSNTSAATFLSSVCLTLSSLIGAWLGNSSNNVFQGDLIFGDTRPSTMSIKYICLLTCFLLAFSCFVQSARLFVYANYLITTPNCVVPIDSVKTAVITGGDFWSLGLRALYFAIDLLLWFFGPIPMFACSIVMVFILHFLDTNTKPLHPHRNQPPQKVTARSYRGVVV